MVAHRKIKFLELEVQYRRKEYSPHSTCRSYGLQSLWTSSRSWMSRCGGCQVSLCTKGKEWICLFYPLCSETAYRGLIPRRHTKLNAWNEMCASNTKIMVCVPIRACGIVRLFIKDHWMLSSLPCQALQFNPTQAATPLWSWLEGFAVFILPLLCLHLDFLAAFPQYNSRVQLTLSHSYPVIWDCFLQKPSEKWHAPKLNTLSINAEPLPIQIMPVHNTCISPEKVLAFWWETKWVLLLFSQDLSHHDEINHRFHCSCCFWVSGLEY